MEGDKKGLVEHSDTGLVEAARICAKIHCTASAGFSPTLADFSS
jgi:hypothetical protein